ncbi:MAG: Asp-tRNA(Asn)/Glu-tRNA(Gln) amidotransferase subunit GatC [Phycisphaerales bacterium JB039]
MPDDTLTPEEVRKVARLAKLRLTEDEVEAERQRLGAVLEHARRLQSLDLTDVEPMAQVGDRPAALREDRPGPTLPVDESLRMAPRSAGPFLVVPRTIGPGGGA